MKRIAPEQIDCLEAFVKTAQYLANLTTRQDVWSEASGLLVNFWGADLGGFGERRSDGTIVTHHCTLSGKSSDLMYFASKAEENIVEVLDTGFLTWRSISSSPEPFEMAFLPISQENRVTKVLLVGHKTSGLLSKDLLNMYLALAGLVGTTAVRLASEAELRKHRRHLEELVAERTTELTNTNEQLQHEISYRRRAEEALQKAHDQLEFKVQERTAELERAKDAVTLERKRLFDILETMPVMVRLLTPDYHVAFANRSFRERFGEHNGRQCFDHLFGKKVPCDFCETYNVLSTGRQHHWQSARPDGAIIDSYDFPFLDTDNSFLILKIDVDITEMKIAQAEREKLISELEAKNAELERFVYSVSHDLKSPLITIRTFLGFVAEGLGTASAENLKTDLNRIDNAAVKMAILLDEILELSRIGRMFNPPSQVPMGDLINETLELLSGSIAQDGVQVEIADDLPVLYGDRPRLREVFQNLIENSLKFTKDQPHPTIEIGARTDGAEKILFVRDNGNGIDPLYHEKVFGLFDKLDPKSEGTGIGLALVKRIVEVHGGRIWVESEGVGHGCTFCFTLPSADLHES